MPNPSISPDIVTDRKLKYGREQPQASVRSQFHFALLIYLGWMALTWLGHVAGTMTIAPQTVTILLIGTGASNVLFFILSRSSVLHRPPVDTLALAQSVVGIAWTTLFAAMSTGAEALIIGMYVSIVAFALLRVSRGALVRVAVFAIISYSFVCFVSELSVQPAALTTAVLSGPLTITGVMLCLMFAGSRVYRTRQRLMDENDELRSAVYRENADIGMNSVNRRYILDLLAREKGRTERSNVPFCICIFTLDHVSSNPENFDKYASARMFRKAEVTMRQGLRDMDSLNPTGFHECFSAYSDREYIAILPQTNLHGAQRSTERVLETVTAKPETATAGHIRLYGGIAEYSRGETISEFIERAQEALGEARTSGFSRVCSRRRQDEPCDSRPASIVRLETRLR